MQASALACTNLTCELQHNPLAVEANALRLSWQRNQAGYVLELEIPSNTTSSLLLPIAEGQQVTEGAASVQGERHSKAFKLEIGSGSYKFEVK